MGRVKLYNLPGCPYCAMVREKLAALNLEYEQVDVPMIAEERKEVIEVSGQPFVPVLVDGSKVLSDENEIIAYLEATYGKERSARSR
ncbi:MAG TPA: glutaredoxin family protein [Limnochordia bacterium]